jgi:hypothetical protein
MSDDLRDDLFLAAVAALNASPPAGVPQTQQERTLDIALEDLPCNVAYPHGERIQELGSTAGRTIRNFFAIRLEATAAAAGGQRPSQAVGKILAWNRKALGGSRLGGLAIRVHEREIKWHSVQAQAAVGRADHVFEIEYTNRVNDAALKT